MATFLEQVAALKATREAKMAEMKSIAQKSVDEQRSMDTAEAEQFDTIEGEIKRLDGDIARLSKLAEIDKASAKPIGEGDQQHKGVVGSEGYRVPVQVKHTEKLEPGIAFARYAMCLAEAKGDHTKAFHFAEKFYPHTESVVLTLKAQSEGFNVKKALVQKAAVAAATTTDATNAGPLVYANTFAGDFINYLRPRTLIGQAQFRPVPFNVRIVGQTSGGTANWVGQGKAKPVTKFDFNATTVPFTKVAAITVETEELIRFADPSAESYIRDSLAACVIAKLDADLFDPDLAAVSNVSPAGLLNGVSPVSIAAVDYGDPDTVRAAIAALWAPWDSTYLGVRPAYYTTPAVARMIAMSREALGTRAFPGMSMTGGEIDGVPVRVSQYLANNGGSGGAPFILVDESEIFLADDGNVTLDFNDQVSLEMDSAPAHDSSTPTAAQLVSMWQTDSVAWKAERFIWWGARRSGAAQWIDGMPTT